MKLVGSSKAVRSPEFHKRKQRERRLKAALITVVVLLLTAGPLMLLRSTRLLIADVSVEGNEVTPSEEIVSIARENLAGAYAWVIPKGSAVLYPRERIESQILESIPRLSSAEVSLSGTRALDIEVKERRPHALYCRSEGASECYFLDETGFIFSEAPNFSGDVYIKYLTEPELEVPMRTQIFKPEEFEKLELFLYNLKVLDVMPETVTRVGDEFELRQQKGPLVKWRGDQDLEALLVDFESFLHNSGLKRSDIARMSYIDLRFDSKVFYRFEGE